MFTAQNVYTQQQAQLLVLLIVKTKIHHAETGLLWLTLDVHMEKRSNTQIKTYAKERMDNMDSKIEISKFTSNEIDEAIDGLDGLQEIIVPMLRKANFDGMTEEDVQKFKRHIMLAKHALIAMGDFLEFKMKQSGSCRN